MEITDLGKADGLPPVDWTAVVSPGTTVSTTGCKPQAEGAPC